MMKKKLLVLVLLFDFFAAESQQNAVDTNFHIYLLIGQSNMAGRGAVDAESKKINPQIFMLDSFNQWVPATDPVHFDKPNAVGVGPALGFANAMLKGNSKINIGLVPCALGGSPIKVWEPGQTYLQKFHPYEDAIARTKLAMQKGVLKGILWHQGESDNDTGRAAIYMGKLKTLINRLRTDLNAPAIPFVAGEIGYFNHPIFINDVIDQLPKQVPFTAVATAENLTDRGDHLHFNTASARELGRRYALEMKKLQAAQVGKGSSFQPLKANSIQHPVVVLCFDDAEISAYSVVAPLLKKYGFNATFMVCEMPWKQPGDSVYYMKWPQIAELYKMGFEIGNHTGHHKNMTTMKPDAMLAEIHYIEDKCAAYGIPKPISFAYPGNRNDSLSQAVLAQAGYKYARTGGSKYFDPAKDNLLAISSYTMGSSEKLQPRTMTALQNLKNGEILAFTIHGVPDIAHPDYTTDPAVFETYLKLMKDKNMHVIAMRDLGKYIPD